MTSVNHLLLGDSSDHDSDASVDSEPQRSCQTSVSGNHGCLYFFKAWNCLLCFTYTLGALVHVFRILDRGIYLHDLISDDHWY